MEKLKIGNIKVNAEKEEKSICTRDGFTGKLVELCKKKRYKIKFDIETYKDIPTIVEIQGKKFYKSDFNELNQRYFYLIEF